MVDEIKNNGISNGTTGTDIKRQTAYKCSIETINKGVFMKRPGWESSFLMTDYGDFSRVNVIAVIVAKDGLNVTLDDGSGKIGARFFDNPDGLNDIIVGDVVIVVGRPREFNNNKYLTLEIIKKVNNIAWVNYRKKELKLIKKVRDMDSQPEVPIAKKEAVIVESSNTTNSRERIIQIITKLDNGEGASIEDIIRMANIRNSEEIIQDLIMRGDIFEYKAGRVKIM